MYENVNQSSDSSDDNTSNALTDGISDAISDGISIPYCQKLPEELIIGSYIEIFGKTNENAERFAINLMTESEDIALHFNPRFKDEFVVRNCRIREVWCNEEREPYYMPFEKNRSFTLIISVNKEVYRLYVNGVHFVDFKHRLPFSSVTSMAIDGDINVLLIKCDRMDADHNWDAFSTKLSETPIEHQSNEIQSFFDPTVPFVSIIPKGLRVGMVLSIIGRPVSNSNKFDINLVQKQNSVRFSNISFHMSVRFGKTIEESKVVRNYRCEGVWGSEDTYCTEFPFLAEKIFDLRIVVESNRFIVIINGKNFTEFPNRLYPLSDTNQIEVNGNLKLFSVRF